MIYRNKSKKKEKKKKSLKEEERRLIKLALAFLLKNISFFFINSFSQSDPKNGYVAVVIFLYFFFPNIHKLWSATIYVIKGL
jgi:hypothetical protein